MTIICLYSYSTEKKSTVQQLISNISIILALQHAIPEVKSNPKQLSCKKVCVPKETKDSGGGQEMAVNGKKINND